MFDKARDADAQIWLRFSESSVHIVIMKDDMSKIMTEVSEEYVYDAESDTVGFADPDDKERLLTASIEDELLKVRGGARDFSCSLFSIAYFRTFAKSVYTPGELYGFWYGSHENEYFCVGLFSDGSYEVYFISALENMYGVLPADTGELSGAYTYDKTTGALELSPIVGESPARPGAVAEVFISGGGYTLTIDGYELTVSGGGNTFKLSK